MDLGFALAEEITGLDLKDEEAAKYTGDKADSAFQPIRWKSIDSRANPGEARYAIGGGEPTKLADEMTADGQYCKVAYPLYNFEKAGPPPEASVSKDDKEGSKGMREQLIDKLQDYANDPEVSSDLRKKMQDITEM